MEQAQIVRLEVDRVITLPFYGSVAANSNETFCSQRLGFPFRVKSLRVQFALNVNRLLRVYFYVSPDDSLPTAEPVTGTNLLGIQGQVGYLVGDGEAVEVPFEAAVEESGMYVKLYVENLDGWVHTVAGQVFITQLPRKE